MTETTISVQKGLNDLKLYASKINRAINETKVATVEQYGAIPNSNQSIADFKSAAQGSLDKVEQLIKNRDAIKGAIIVSNAVETVKIGKETMTVAEAIERKESINFDMSLLNTLKSQLRDAINTVSSTNARIDADTERIIESQGGKDAKTDGAIDFAKATREAAEARKAKTLEGVKDLEKLISEKEDKIETFLSEVDFVLTESNVKTNITIDLA